MSSAGPNPKATPAAPSGANPPIDGFLKTVIGIGSGLALGGMLGSLALVERGAAGKLVARWHWAAVPLMLVGLVMGVQFWRMMFRFETDETDARKRLFKRAAGALGVVAIVSFLYPLRFVESEQRGEVFLGLGVAVVVLSGFGTLIYKTIRWVNENEPKDGEID